MKCLAFLVACVVVVRGQDLLQLKSQCKVTKDPLDCIKYRAFDVLQQASTKDVVQVVEGVEIVRNSDVQAHETGRSLVDDLESYIETHDLRISFPEAVGGGSMTVSPRELDADKISLTVSSNANAVEEGKSRRKSKLKKILIPILVFVLLKAMTLIPLALGVLGLKAWNALQLSFFSFVTSLALAIFQLCKKVANEGLPVAHTAWDPYHYAARNLFVGDESAQQMAYNAYAQQ